MRMKIFKYSWWLIIYISLYIIVLEALYWWPTVILLVIIRLPVYITVISSMQAKSIIM